MSKFRNPIIHSNEVNEYAGDYEINDAALERYKTPRDQFGNSRVLVSAEQGHVVKDFIYRLDDDNNKKTDAVGMRIIPVSDTHVLNTSDGRFVPGFQILDDHLRDAMGLSKSDPIFSYLSYFHVEENAVPITELHKTNKLQMGFTHTGTYLGNGLTSNAPVHYHWHQFGVDKTADGKDGYPANVYFVSLENVEQPVLNANGVIVDSILNHGVNFPHNYQAARFRIVKLNTVFMFYRDWLKRDPKLLTDESWFTYCMAHKAIVTNVMLNLPHNEASFCEVYGNVEGVKIFEAFKKRYYNVHGHDFQQKDETHFEPLWKKEGLTRDQIRPLSEQEYTAYKTAFEYDALDTFSGMKPLEPTLGTAWGPLYSADAIMEFISTYTSMLDVGAVFSATVLMGFMDEITKRMGIAKEKFLEFAMPIVRKMMVADARVNAQTSPSTYVAVTFATLYKYFGGEGNPEELFKDVKFDQLLHTTGPDFDAALWKIVSAVPFDESQETNGEKAFVAGSALRGVLEAWTEITTAEPITPEQAYDAFRESATEDIEKARAVPVRGEEKIQNIMPPAVLHLASIKAFPINKFVSVKTVGTIVQEKDVQIKQTKKSVVCQQPS